MEILVMEDSETLEEFARRTGAGYEIWKFGPDGQSCNQYIAVRWEEALPSHCCDGSFWFVGTTSEFLEE